MYNNYMLYFIYDLFINPVDRSLFSNINKDITHRNITNHFLAVDHLLAQHRHIPLTDRWASVRWAASTLTWIWGISVSNRTARHSGQALPAATPGSELCMPNPSRSSMAVSEGMQPLVSIGFRGSELSAEPQRPRQQSDTLHPRSRRAEQTG